MPKNDYSEKALTKLRERAEAVLRNALPLTIEYGRSSPLPEEITNRVVANARIVGRRGLRDQVLIVLADYRYHSWTNHALEWEGVRLKLADQIVKG